MDFIERVIDNKVFLLALDKFYRAAMKKHERGELLMCARRVAQVLGAPPANVIVESYYAKDKQLSEYFCLIRSLQNIDATAKDKVASLTEYQRLLEVASSPLFGSVGQSDQLLPVGRDALSLALESTFPSWTIESLTDEAYRRAMETDEFSLVGLAARAKDALVITAMRESVVLYGMIIGAALNPPPPKYIWMVDEDLVRHAKRFINTFNAIFHEELPPPHPSQAERIWYAFRNNDLDGRCVRLGYDDTITPVRNYHWAIRFTDKGRYEVHEFWDTELWTTSRYRASRNISEPSGWPFDEEL
jgi:hypothetical protein